ncbi:MAG: MlaD family protein [Kiritimatiellia bacterium]
MFSELVVGLFMVVVLALLAYFTIVISGVDLLTGRSRVRVRAEFADVGGLKDRDSVMYRGMKVGAVERIDLGSTNILVTLAVDRDVVLRESCRLSVEALSLLGGNYLLLEEGAGRVLPLATTTFRGEPPVNLLRDASRLIGKLDESGGLSSILPETVRTNLEQVSANLNRILARLERGEGTVGRLLADDATVYADLTNAVAGAKATFDGARRTFDNVAEITDRLKRGDGTLGKLLATNDVVYADLKRTLANAAAISDRLERGEGALGKLLAPDDPLWGDFRQIVANLKATTEKLRNKDGLLARLTDDRELADNAARLVSSLKNVAERLEKGEGTLGKLTTRSDLHDEIDGLLKDVRQIIDNYRDTTPITTFGSLVTGAL